MSLRNTMTLVAMLTVAGGTLAAQSGSKKDTPLTLTGCVVQGERSDSYMLTNMQVVGAGASLSPAGAFYRIDSTKGFKDHVNHRVELAGVADLSDVDKGTVETKTSSAGQTTASINSERRTTTAPAATVGLGASSKVAVDTYKFEVKTLTMLSSTCF
jgi:hypothetical protein